MKDLNEANEFKIDLQMAFRLLIDKQFEITRLFVLAQLSTFMLFVIPMIWWVNQEPKQRLYIPWLTQVGIGIPVTAWEII